MKRRTFLAAAAAGLAAQTAPDAEIEVSLQQASTTISPDIYGHFIEHLGAVIYDGIWVGTDSRVPNVGGIRRQFVEDMKQLRAPNLRWPGGCFADGYNWRDGIGAAASRPRTYNYWQRSLPKGLDHTETNQFGLHEFMRLCKLTGAQPYLAANVGSGSPREFQDLVLYSNAPAGTATMANQRAANGDKEPFGVSWWGVGNESWGCGGDMKPGEYARLYRLFVTQLPVYPPRARLIAAGPRGHSKDLDLAWTEGFFDGMRGHRTPVDGFALHFYSDFRNGRGLPTKFDAAGWYDVMREGLRTEEVMLRHWDIMGRFDPEHRTKLVVDEWGVWYSPGEETAPAHILSQPGTLRDALHTAITFDLFNRHADKVSMANVAQTINCLHSLFLADGNRYVRTPIYYAFEMYRPHMGGLSAPIQIRAAERTAPGAAGEGKLPALIGSASLNGKRLTVTVTNPWLDSAVRTRIRCGSATPSEARGTTLTHAQMNARNRFDEPEQVRPRALAVSVQAGAVEFIAPPRSVNAIELLLA